MDKHLYRVEEGANLSLYLRGTEIGSVVSLTEAEAMYELALGRLTRLKAKEAKKISPATSDGTMGDEPDRSDAMKVMEVDAPLDQVERAKLEAARRRR